MSRRTPLLSAAVAVVKGAVCLATGLPLGRSTKSVKFASGGRAVLLVGPVTAPPPPAVEAEIRLAVAQKIREDAPFRVFADVPRALAEKIYGDAIFDDFGVPAAVARLRLVVLDEWGVNANTHPVPATTGCLGEVDIGQFKFVEPKKVLEVHFCVKGRGASGGGGAEGAGAAAGGRGCSGGKGGGAAGGGSGTEGAGSGGGGSVAPAAAEDPPLATETPWTEELQLPPLAAVLPPGTADAGAGAADAAADGEQTVTPWEVSATAAVDYDKLVRRFGCAHISESLVQRVEAVTHRRAHHLLRRKIFFSHRDLDKLLAAREKGRRVYIYTGRGPSSESLHLGHLIPMMFTKWLQDAFNVPLVLQLTEDEKFLFKENLELDEARRLARENAKDLIALGFDEDKTFIFRNTDYIGNLYPTVLRVQKKVTFNQARGIFGFTDSDNVGKIAFPAVQAAPSFACCFPDIFGPSSDDVWCLVPQAIDQDPYFRMTRDAAPRLGLLKPAIVHSKFLPALQGSQTKMSGSCANTTILVSDGKAAIREKVMKYAFSGGRDTTEEHRRLGANLGVDVAYQYLTFLLEDDARLEDIARRYAAGEMLTGEVKAVLVDTVAEIVEKHQAARAAVTEDVVDRYMNPRRDCFRRFWKTEAAAA